MLNNVLDTIKKIGFSEFLVENGLNESIWIHLKGRIDEGEINDDDNIRSGALRIALPEVPRILGGYNKDFCNQLELCKKGDFVEIMGYVVFDSYVNPRQFFPFPKKVLHFIIVAIKKATDDSPCFSNVIMNSVDLAVMNMEYILSIPNFEQKVSVIRPTAFYIPLPSRFKEGKLRKYDSEYYEAQLRSGQWIKCPKDYFKSNTHIIKNTILSGHLHQLDKSIVVVADSFQE